MRKYVAVCLLCLLLGIRAPCSEPRPPSSALVVATEDAALAIALPFLQSYFDQKTFNAQRPYRATLFQGTWYVHGQMPDGALGELIRVDISAQTGKILDFRPKLERHRAGDLKMQESCCFYARHPDPAEASGQASHHHAPA